MTSPPTSGVIRGTVAYRQRMALLPGSSVEVTLADVSRQDAAATVIASTTVDPGGRQVPIPFELAYDTGAIDPAHTYAVRASIQHEGRTLFTTDAAAHVITRGNPTEVALMLVEVREPAPAPRAAGLVGTSWVLTELDGHPVAAGTRPTLEFLEEGRAAGHGSCNRFFGAVTVAGETISFGAVGSTQMACLETAMSQERRYLQALGQAHRFTRDGRALLIHLKDSDHPLRFEPGGTAKSS